MSEDSIKCPVCLKAEVKIFNRMLFQTTEVKKLIIGYSCQSCNHRWQVFAYPDKDSSTGEIS